MLSDSGRDSRRPLLLTGTDFNSAISTSVPSITDRVQQLVRIDHDESSIAHVRDAMQH